MAIQLSDAVRNARLDSIETTIGTAGAILRIRTLAQPANCAAADVGSILAEMTLASDWMANASTGTKAKQGTWQDASANAAGTAQHFRLYDAAGTVCGLQGSVGQGTGDLSLDNTNIAAGQQVTINTFTLTDGNA
jgi:hypothetical protein